MSRAIDDSMKTTAAPAVGAGGIDWAAHWRELVETRRVVIEGLANQGPQTGFWDQRAGRYARRVQSLDPTTDPLTQMLLGLARPGETVLDVGAGTGRYAIPLAAIASRVTAVEPAQAMRAQLEQALGAGGPTNIDLVASTWEAAQVAQHDVVLCANVLYPIADAAAFVTKLDAHARRVGAIIIRVDQMAAMIDPMWHAIWERGCPPEPGLLDLYNLLFALGIRANVRLAHRANPQRYADLDDALRQAHNQLFLPMDDTEHDDRIRAYLSKTLVPRDGELESPFAPQYALAWWEKE
jgi:SAM-dependent methyltransferase